VLLEGCRKSSAFRRGGLCGGNEQKTVLARWLGLSPKVLVLDEPTHGVDVGAKSEVDELIQRVAGSGIAIALISSELPEVIAMADRRDARG
jgi:ribose transport system ATP-binding protein